MGGLLQVYLLASVFPWLKTWLVWTLIISAVWAVWHEFGKGGNR